MRMNWCPRDSSASCVRSPTREGGPHPATTRVEEIGGQPFRRMPAVRTMRVLSLTVGRELAERLAELRSETRVLFMSGYTDDSIGPSRDHGQGNRLPAKRFTPDSLEPKVREVLEASSAAPGNRSGQGRGAE